MPEKETLERAKEDKREGKAPSTQAGEFIREEMHHIREGKHGARSTKQAIAIGLSKGARDGRQVAAAEEGASVEEDAHQRGPRLPGGPIRATAQAVGGPARAVLGALKREGHAAASHTAIGATSPTRGRRNGRLPIAAGLHRRRNERAGGTTGCRPQGGRQRATPTSHGAQRKRGPAASGTRHLATIAGYCWPSLSGSRSPVAVTAFVSTFFNEDLTLEKMSNV